MRKAIVLAAVIVGAGWQPLAACGDKILMVGRGVRYQRAYAAVHPANILIYARPTTKSDRAIRDAQFQKSLRQAGHRVSVIEDAALFAHALTMSGFDVVLADLNEAPSIDAQVAAAPSRPKALYVEFPAAVSQSRELAAQYACELKAGDRTTRFLDRIEAEMKTRASRRSSDR